MAINFTDDLVNQSPYKESIEKIDEFALNLYLGGNREDVNIRPLILNMPNFFLPKVTDDVFEHSGTKTGLATMGKLLKQVDSQANNQYSKEILELLYNKEKNMLINTFTLGFTFTQNERLMNKFVETKPDTEKIYHELYNLAGIVFETRGIFNQVTKDLDFNDEKTHQVVSKILKLYEARVTNIHKGLQTFGPFLPGTYDKYEFATYYVKDREFNLQNYGQYIDEEIKKLNEPKNYKTIFDAKFLEQQTQASKSK